MKFMTQLSPAPAGMPSVYVSKVNETVKVLPLHSFQMNLIQYEFGTSKIIFKCFWIFPGYFPEISQLLT